MIINFLYFLLLYSFASAHPIKPLNFSGSNATDQYPLQLLQFNSTQSRYIILDTFQRIVYLSSSSWMIDDKNLCLIEYSVWSSIKEITIQFNQTELYLLRYYKLKIEKVEYETNSQCKAYVNWCINGKFQYPLIFCGNQGCDIPYIENGIMSHNITGQNKSIAYRQQTLTVTCDNDTSFNPLSSPSGNNTFNCYLFGINNVPGQPFCILNTCTIPISQKYRSNYRIVSSKSCNTTQIRYNKVAGRCKVLLDDSIYTMENGRPTRQFEFYCNENNFSVPDSSIIKIRQNACVLNKTENLIEEDVKITQPEAYKVSCQRGSYSEFSYLFCEPDENGLLHWRTYNLTGLTERKAINMTSTRQIEQFEVINNSTRYDNRTSNRSEALDFTKVCQYLDCNLTKEAVKEHAITCSGKFCELNKGYNIEIFGEKYYNFLFICIYGGIPFNVSKNHCEAKYDNAKYLEILSPESCRLSLGFWGIAPPTLSIWATCKVKGIEGYRIAHIKGVTQTIVCTSDKRYKPDVIDIIAGTCKPPRIRKGILLDGCKDVKKGGKCYYLCDRDASLGIDYSGFIECEDDPLYVGKLSYRASPDCEGPSQVWINFWVFVIVAIVFILLDWFLLTVYLRNEK